MGCARRNGPANTLDRYARHLAAGRYADAYELLSREFRQRVSREAFVAQLKGSAREVQATVELLRQGGAVAVSAEVAIGLGETLRLIQEDGRWRISDDVLAFYDQRSPRATLRSFLRAYQLQRWDVMLRFVPSAYAAQMDAAKLQAQFTGPSKANIEALLTVLRSHVAEPIEEIGNQAVLRYGEASEIVFVREDGIWKIKDLD